MRSSRSSQIPPRTHADHNNQSTVPTWLEIFGCERLTGALLDRLTHRVHIIETNSLSYRLRQSGRRLPTGDAQHDQEDSSDSQETGSGGV
ncbi:ATP-binding protein [Sedimentisphaerales bacterium M17dextr]|uniref:ATP-binding protein n=1 Tax=Anaerobaca lacustris TaxID=3044600 RepID=A0AAW6U6L2_9BACT|nr:ATP-binding protein [Sedimentisphaerales bacterium M17dextr]